MLSFIIKSHTTQHTAAAIPAESDQRGANVQTTLVVDQTYPHPSNPAPPAAFWSIRFSSPFHLHHCHRHRFYCTLVLFFMSVSEWRFEFLFPFPFPFPFPPISYSRPVHLLLLSSSFGIFSLVFTFSSSSLFIETFVQRWNWVWFGWI